MKVIQCDFSLDEYLHLQKHNKIDHINHIIYFNFLVQVSGETTENSELWDKSRWMKMSLHVLIPRGVLGGQEGAGGERSSISRQRGEGLRNT